MAGPKPGAASFMSRVRPSLVVAHRLAGLVIAGFLLVAGATGAILAFQTEIDAALNPKLFRAKAEGERLPPSTLIARAEAADPRVRVTSLFFATDPGTTVRLGVGAKGASDGGPPLPFNQMFLDPADGEVLGVRRFGACCLQRENLIPFLWELHQSLYLPSPWGRWLMGSVAIIWLADSVVGFVLTLPVSARRRSLWWERWKLAWAIKRGASSYRFTFDLHRAGGLWLWGLLILLAASSIALNLPAEVARPAVAAFSPPTPTIFETRRLDPEESRAPMSWDAALARAQSEAEQRGWRAPLRSMFHTASSGLYGVRFHKLGGHDAGARWVYLDDVTGAVVDVRAPGLGSAGDQVLDVQLPLHGGSIAGLPGRIAIAAAGAGVAMLSVTGVVIWWRKRGPRMAARRRASPRRASLEGGAHAAD